MKALVSMKTALFQASNCITEIHKANSCTFRYYKPVEFVNPSKSLTVVSALNYKNARIQRKLDVVLQALYFLGYNKEYLEKLNIEWACSTDVDFAELQRIKTSALLSKYNTGLTVDNARKDVIELKNIEVQLNEKVIKCEVLK